jgi:hypothetical protein
MTGGKVVTCRECFEEFVNNPSVRTDDGFCSDACMKRYDREYAGEVLDDCD